MFDEKTDLGKRAGVKEVIKTFPGCPLAAVVAFFYGLGTAHARDFVSLLPVIIDKFLCCRHFSDPLELLILLNHSMKNLRPPEKRTQVILC